ncbi:MAG: hypothetical protein MN733_03480 [Nitrososphaera sp.]|nr:hypothetical protein [Nitrososphaera sp.]
MLNQRPDYFPQGINCYVPKMKYASDVRGPVHKLRVDWGAPVIADADGILDNQSIATAGETATFAATYTVAKMTPYGRNLTVVASGAATSNVTVYGEDYLGQPMAESFTLNGTTPVNGQKAFKRVLRVTFGATAATTIDLGWGDVLGLPFVTMAVEREFADNVLQSAGTFAAPIFTDPQTLTTDDPRGTYNPTVTLDGVVHLEADIVVTDFVNSAGNGGLHGIRHVVA